MYIAILRHFVHEGNMSFLQSLDRLYVPNVVVAHEKEGIEAIHLASGRTLCKVQDAS